MKNDKPIIRADKTRQNVKETPKRERKTRKNAKPTPQSDFFTALIRDQLNAECVMEHRFHPVRRWRFDYAIIDHRIAIEVEGGVWTGGRHISPKGFLNDIEKYNTATVMGWRVIRTVPERLHSTETLDMIREMMAPSC